MIETEYQDDGRTAGIIVFRPLNPVTAGHRLFVPKRHVSSAAEAPIVAGAVFEAAAQYGRDRYDDFNLITSVGAAATQTVGHLHVHLVPRWAEDGLLLPWSGCAMPNPAVGAEEIRRLRERAEAGNPDLADDTSCILGYDELTGLLDSYDALVAERDALQERAEKAAVKLRQIALVRTCCGCQDDVERMRDLAADALAALGESAGESKP